MVSVQQSEARHGVHDLGALQGAVLRKQARGGVWGQRQDLVRTIGRVGLGKSISGSANRRRLAGRTTTGVPRGSDAKMRHCLNRKLHRAGLASTEVRGRALFWSRRVITLTTTTPMLVYYRPVSDLGHLQICKATHGGETGRRGGCSKNLRALRSTDPPSRGPLERPAAEASGEGRVIYGG